MPFPFKMGIGGLGVISVLQVTPSFGWDYSSTAWVGNCSSTIANQSPIDIAAFTESSVLTPPQTYDFVTSGFPDSAGQDAIVAQLVVNNHTWELEWDEDDAAENPYGLQIGDKLYRLAQYHYHSPSEHTVNGQHFDMEAHHVHFCEGPSCETDDPNDEILVVAVFMKVGAENAYLDQFWNDFNTAPGAAQPQVSRLENPYTTFMPSDKSYWSYVGSTTTPPCAQNVQWRLLEQTVEMSQAQLTAYHTSVNTLVQPATPAILPAGVSAGWVNATKTNNRPIQLLGSRTVLHFKAPEPDADGGLPPWLLPLLLGSAAVALVAALACLYLHSKPKGTTRGVKPKPPARKQPAPKEESVPLMPPPLAAPPLLAAPNLSMVVQPQPLMQALPQAYTTTLARPAAPYGQVPVQAAPYGQVPMLLQP